MKTTIEIAIGIGIEATDELRVRWIGCEGPGLEIQNALAALSIAISIPISTAMAAIRHPDI